MTKAEKAVDYYSRGFNCTQAVLASFAAELGMEEDTALKIGTQFGGGARCGELCGSVSGALMVLGLKYGHYHEGDTDEKARAYSIAVEFNKRFTDKNGSVVCRELLKYDLTVPEDMAAIREKDLFHTLCPELIADAANIAEQIINENERTE